MKHSELKDLAKRADRSEGEERERLVRELVEKLSEVDALEGVSSRALIPALKISRRMSSEEGRDYTALI